LCFNILNRQRKLIDLLTWATARISEANINEARLNAERLLAHVLSVNRIDLYLDFNRPLLAEEIQHYTSLLQRRLEHEPLQYILGETEFMSLRFKVTPAVLIPRPETEILVENAIAQITRVFGKETKVSCLDIGTGSGNIAISLAYYLKNLRVWAVDISEAALSLAKENAELNGVADRIHFRRLDVTSGDFPQQIERKFDVVVTNPPYMDESEYLTLPPGIRQYEPKLALDGGSDGLQFYRVLASSMKAILTQRGMAFLEIGANQAEYVINIFAEKLHGSNKIFHDLAGLDRVLLIFNT